MKSNSGKLTGWLTGTNEKPIDLDDATPVQIRDESDGEGGNGLADYAPVAQGDRAENKRRRDQDEPGLFLANDEDISEDEGFQMEKRARGAADLGGESEDKKKLDMDLSYDGFSIYGRILCLVVKRRGGKGGRPESTVLPEQQGGKQMLENWVSTQAAQDQVIGND